MAFQFGRAGRTITLLEPVSWRSGVNTSGSGVGSAIEVHGSVIVTPNTDAVRLRDQFLGYQNNGDESIVPVIVDSEPRLTGYYRVLDVQITNDNNILSAGYFDYTIQMEAVAGFTQPALESILAGALLPNAVGAVAADVFEWHGAPNAVTEYWRGFAYTRYHRTSADGIMLITTSGSIATTAKASFALAPANFYVGAATIEQGAPFQPLVGRMLTQPDFVNWRLSNGLLRVTPSGGTLNVSHYNGSTWGALKNYNIFETFNGNTIAGFSAMTVLRNSPEECIIRLACVNAFTAAWGGRVWLDLSLRRGDRMMRGYLTSDNSGADTWGVGRTVAEAAALSNFGAVTSGGISANANDADGNRYVLCSYQAAVANDLVNGKLTQSAHQQTLDFGIGSVIGGGGVVAPDDAVSLCKQYLAAESETQRVVAR